MEQSEDWDGNMGNHKAEFGSGSVAFALVAAVLSMACGAEQGSIGESVATVSDSDGISWEAFRASAEIAPNGALVVERDMAFSSEEKLRRYWEQYRAPGRGQALTVNLRRVEGTILQYRDLWPFPQHMNLTYCIGNGFSSQQLDVLLPAFDQAAEAWSRVAAIRFERKVLSICGQTSNSVTFDVQYKVGNSTSPFPGDARLERTMYIGSFAFGHLDFGKTLVGIVTHELGHILGYRHEHIWAGHSSPSDSTSTAELITDYDAMSVMHYPDLREPQGGGFKHSDLDHQGSAQLYGLHPAHIVNLL